MLAFFIYKRSGAAIEQKEAKLEIAREGARRPEHRGRMRERCCEYRAQIFLEIILIQGEWVVLII